MRNLDRLNDRRKREDLDILAEAATGQGIRFQDIEVLSDKFNLVVSLTGADVIVRSPGTVGLVRQGKEMFSRDLAVASYLRDNNLPIVPPLLDEPLEAEGMVFSFWQEVQSDGPVDPEKVGWALRSCHEALESFDRSLLGDWTIIDEALTILREDKYRLAIKPDDRKRAIKIGENIKKELFQAETVPVHGDAHWRNVIHSKEGPLWNDWEDAHLAPRVWDLACLRTSSWFDRQIKQDARTAIETYGPHQDMTLAKQGRTMEHIAWGSLLAVYYQEDIEQHQQMVRDLLDRLE